MKRRARARRQERLACIAAAAALAIGASAPARADAPEAAAQLDYDAAAGCPARDSFEAVVSGRLGYSPFHDGGADRVIVRIAGSGRSLAGRLEWRDATGAPIGEQTFPSRSGDCAELAKAIGFALALHLQLMAATAEPPAAPPPAPPPPAPAPAPPPPAPAPVVVRPAPGPALVAGAGGSLGLGVASGPVGLVRLFGEVRWPHLALEASLEGSTPTTTRRADGAGFSQEQFLAGLAGCGLLSLASACAVAKAGDMRVTGEGVDAPRTASGLLLEAGLRVAASRFVGRRTYISARAEGLALLTQGKVTLDAVTLWTTPRYAALLGIDVGLKFR
jgi:hypothetical protein